MPNTDIRSRLKELLADPITPKLILKYLESETGAPIPDRGILAGQSVASAFYKLAGLPINSIVNDLDIFIPDDENFKEVSKAVNLDIPDYSPVKGNTNFSSLVSFYQVTGREFNPYDGVSNILKKDLYQIVKSYEAGHFNIVPVDFLRGAYYRHKQDGHYDSLLNCPLFFEPVLSINRGVPATRSQTDIAIVISAFDLNCVRIGIDLETGALMYTNQFLDFCVTRELKIIRLNTPVQTLIRFIVKKEKLGVFGNTEVSIKMCSEAVSHAQLTEPYVDARVNAFLENNFYIAEPIIRKIESKYASGYAKGFTPRDFLNYSKNRTGTGAAGIPLVIGSKYSKQLSVIPGLDSIFECIPHKTKALTYVKAKSCITSNFSTPSIRTAMWHYMDLPECIRSASLTLSKPIANNKATTESFFNKYYEENKDTSMPYIHMITADPSKYFNAASESDIEALIRTGAKHHEFYNSVTMYPMADQVLIYKYYRNLFKKLGLDEAGWGLYPCWYTNSLDLFLNEDSKAYSMVEFTAAITAILNQEPEDPSIGTLLQRRVAEAIKDTIGTKDPLYSYTLPLPSQIKGVKVKELTSQFDLNVEGSQMKHCVRGYGSFVRYGTSRIIAFDYNQESRPVSRLNRATAEWRILFDSKTQKVSINCAQIRSHKNVVPNPELISANEALIEMVTQALNDNLDEVKNTILIETRCIHEEQQGRIPEPVPEEFPF